MMDLGKLIVILAAFRFFVWDLLAPFLNLTNAAQITVIISISFMALIFGIVFVLRRR